MKNNCLIIAGEKSGEEHCLSFFDGLKNNCKSVHFWGVGGDDLKSKGMELIYHLKDFSSWGISEVIFKIPFYLKAMNRIYELAKERKCKVAILIDFQSFNLKLAKKLKKMGVEILYYVAPQAWVWKSWRAKVIGKTVHTLFTIIPFEKRWFINRGTKNVVSIDHPLWKHYKDLLAGLELGSNKKKFSKFQKQVNLLLLPGSRRFEVRSLLPEFIGVYQELKKSFKVELSIVKSPNVPDYLYQSCLDSFDRVYSSDKLAQALINADFSLAASGTVTLATALFEVPTIVCYKGSLLNEFIYYNLIDYDGYISLANIVHNEEVFPEVLQDRVSGPNIGKYLMSWLTHCEEYEKIKKKLAKTKLLVQGDYSDISGYISGVINSVYQ